MDILIFKVPILFKDFHEVAFSIHSDFDASYYPWETDYINFTVLYPAMGGGVRNEGFEAPVSGIYREAP